MKLHIIVMRDIVANVYGQPNFVPHIGGAIRGFADQVNGQDKTNILAAHPEDFELFKIGTYDDSNASFELHEPEQIAVGKNLLLARQ